MEDFDSFLPKSAEKKKIPYDQDPILRSSRRQYSGEQGGGSGGNGSKNFGLFKAVVSFLVIAVVVLGIFVGVAYSRSKNTASQLSGNFADSSYRSHTTTGDNIISATATNIAMRSSVSVESHNTSSTESHTYTAGSGVIIDDSNGYVTILTNYHVVYSSSSKNFAPYVYILLSDYVNTFKNKEIYAARRILCEVVGGSYSNDLAVIRFARAGNAEQLYVSSNAIPVTIGDSSSLAFGDPVFAVGNPNGDGIDVKTGVVSKPEMVIKVDVRSNNVAETITCIQTDTAINGGNSGGGLFDSNGNLIGIVNAKANNTSIDNFLENTSYAIPIDVAYAIAWNVVRNGGSLYSPSIGANYKYESYTVKSTDGAIAYKCKVIISSIDSSGVGFTAGLRDGDQIVSATYFNKARNRSVTVAIDHTYSLAVQEYYLSYGDEITLEVLRSGVSRTIVVTMGQTKKIG